MFYEVLEDGTIGRSTNNTQIAQQLGLSLKTNKEIVYGYDGKRYFKGDEPTAPEPTYTQKRQAEYPALAEQFDRIYWDKVNGTNLWQSKIAQIKAKYPKV